MPGIILILIGAALLAVQLLHLGGEVVLLALGAAFLCGYALSRSYGLLIPGSILLGLGIGLVLESSRTLVSGPVLGLAAGFFLIALVDWLVGRATRPWPLIPGLVLAIVGINDEPRWSGFTKTLGDFWPLLLIVAGIALLVRRGRPAGRPPV